MGILSKWNGSGHRGFMCPDVYFQGSQPQTGKSCGISISHCSGEASTGESKNTVPNNQKWCSWVSYVHEYTDVSTVMSAMVKPLLKWITLLIMAAPFPIHVKMYLKNENCALTIKKLLLHYMVILPVTWCTDHWDGKAHIHLIHSKPKVFNQHSITAYTTTIITMP